MYICRWDFCEREKYQKVGNHLFPVESPNTFQGDLIPDAQAVDDFAAGGNDNDAGDY